MEQHNGAEDPSSSIMIQEIANNDDEHLSFEKADHGDKNRSGSEDSQKEVFAVAAPTQSDKANHHHPPADGDEEHNDNNNSNDDDDDSYIATSRIVLPPLTYRQHSYHILMLATPIILSEIFQNTMPIIDLAFVGRLSKEDLAAAALATVWFNLWNATLLGFCTALDTVLAQSYGAGQLDVFRAWTGNGLIIVMVVTLFMGALLSICEPVMVMLGQEEDLAHEAGRFSNRLIPGIFPYYAFKVLIKHLQTQDILAPGVVIGILANGFNILANWALIFGLDMGLDGAPWATSLTRLCEFVLMLAYFVRNRSTVLEKTWPSFAPRKLFCHSDKATKGFLRIAMSGATSMAAEAWSFEITTILAGLLGTTALDAHVITLTIATFLYLSFPFAVGLAASIRVGHLVGEGRSVDAMRSSVTSLVLTAAIQATLIIILLPSSKALSDFFSPTQDVADLVVYLLPLSCIFMMADSIQSTGGGIFRGLGRQRLVLMLNIAGFWILAVPVGALLTFVADIGVEGLVRGQIRFSNDSQYSNFASLSHSTFVSLPPLSVVWIYGRHLVIGNAFYSVFEISD